jgi:hypothetical protein
MKGGSQRKHEEGALYSRLTAMGGRADGVTLRPTNPGVGYDDGNHGGDAANAAQCSAHRRIAGAYEQRTERALVGTGKLRILLESSLEMKCSLLNIVAG